MRMPQAAPWPRRPASCGLRPMPLGAYRVGPPESNFTREAYLKALTRIRENIGDW